ncbi:MAG: 50S ribosomal protein L25 [Candidatus Saccharimonadales bacterium]
MNEITLKLDERIVQGKKVAKLRADGFVPSVVYGGNAEPMSTQSLVVETTKVTHQAGKHTPVHLMINGKNTLAIIKNIDIDPVRHEVRHVAFHTIKQNEKIVTEVPIHLTGENESPAERAGLVVLQAIEHVEIRAIPANLPEALEVSILGLTTTEDKLTLADIKLPEGVEFADHEQDVELVVANVYEPSALQAANEAAGGTAEDESEVEAENGSEEAAPDAEADTKKESK